MTTDQLIPLLVFASVMAFGGAVILARAARRQAIEARLRGGQAGADLPPGAPPKVVGLVQAIGTILTPGSPSAKLGEQLARAGYFGRSAPAIYLGAKAVLFIGGAAGLALLLWPLSIAVNLKILYLLLGAGVLYFLPNLFLSGQRKRRTLAVRSYLPDVSDLLEVCVSAGMGLDMAWNAVGDEIRHVSSVMGDEMALTNLEVLLGATRAEAMRHMAERTGVDELASLVAVLVQSERFGTSVGEAMRVFAQSMRENRSQRAEEIAEKMAVKMLFPLVVFIFPTIIIVTAGPAAIKIVRLFLQTPH